MSAKTFGQIKEELRQAKHDKRLRELELEEAINHESSLLQELDFKKLSNKKDVFVRNNDDRKAFNEAIEEISYKYLKSTKYCRLPISFLQLRAIGCYENAGFFLGKINNDNPDWVVDTDDMGYMVLIPKSILDK
jgi:hypothetical protein